MVGEVIKSSKCTICNKVSECRHVILIDNRKKEYNELWCKECTAKIYKDVFKEFNLEDIKDSIEGMIGSIDQPIY